MRGKVEWVTVWFLATLAVNYAQSTTPVIDTLPGEPGIDFPIYADIPKTPFSCEKQPFTGYYADVDTNCQAYHLCEDGGNQTSFLCPNGTIFNQTTQTCDEWYKVDCKQSPQLFWRNKYFDRKSKSGESIKQGDSNVDDGNTNGLKENNSSGSVVSENNEILNLKVIHDLIDSEITNVLQRKQFEGGSLNSSQDTETNFQKLRESMSNGNSSQFKESLNVIISARVEAMRDSMKLNNTEYDGAQITKEEIGEMNSQRKSKTAEKIFTLLSYVDKIKTTLTDSISSQSGTSMDKTKSEILPRFGEKLYKMLNVLEKKQSMTTNSRANNNSSSRFNLANDIDFFDSHKYFVKNNEVDKDTQYNHNTNSWKEGKHMNLNDNFNHSLNESTFEKDLNTSTRAELDFLGDEASIDMIQRILDIARKNLPSSTDAKVDNISKSIDTSLVKETPDTNASRIVDDSGRNDSSDTNASRIVDDSGRNDSSDTNASRVVDDSDRNDSYHKSINDIIKSYEMSENNSKSFNDGINGTNEINKAAIPSEVSGEIPSSNDSYDDNLSDTYDYDEYSDEGINDDVSNKMNSWGKNESNVDSSQGNSANVDAGGENVNNAKSNDENVSRVDAVGQNISKPEHEEGLHEIKNVALNSTSGERVDTNLNQNSTSGQTVSNEENVNKTHGFYENLIKVLNSQENVNHTIVFGGNITRKENDTNTNNGPDANVDKEDGSIVDMKGNNGSDDNVNSMMGEDDNNSLYTSNALLNEGIKEALDKSAVNLNDTKTVRTDDNEIEEHHDELIGILKGIYSTIDEEE